MIGAALSYVAARFRGRRVAGRLSCQLVQPDQSRWAKLALVAGAGLALYGAYSIYQRVR
jgi:hypothetical protein